jgi:xanthine dehydrogenase YagS FAD-binding subunit
MQPFEYVAADDVANALELVRPAGARYIAGGTTLIDLMKEGVETPTTVVDINALPLAGVDVTVDGVIIGALARMSDVAYDATIRERFPMVSEALLAGASGQLRNMASIGGNLLQRTRCPYFREPVWACNKREPGSGCTALEAPHRSHAIFGTSEDCIATHPSDVAVAFAALDAVVRTSGRDGTRSIPFADFHTLPGEHPEIESTLQPGELIVGVELPFSSATRYSTYLKLRDRASYEFALVSVAAGLHIADGAITEARIAFGGVGTKPWRSPEAEAALRGQPATLETYERAAEAALEPAQPLRDNGFKVTLLKNALVRTLTTLSGRA